MKMSGVKAWIEKDKARIQRAHLKKMALSARERRRLQTVSVGIVVAWGVGIFVLLSGFKGLAFVGKMLFVAVFVAAFMDIELSDEDWQDAAHGMLHALDKNSGVLSVAQVSATSGDKDLPIVSLGAFLTEGAGVGRMKVSAVQEGSPAAAAGLRTGDRIVRILDKDVSERYFTASSINDTLRTLRTPRESLRLTVLRGAEEIDLDLNMAPWTSSEVYDLGLRAGVLHIAIGSFRRGVSEDVRALIEKHQKLVPITGVMFDLRGNPGGLLDEATALASFFVPQGSLVSLLEGRRVKTSEERTKLPEAFPEIVRVGVIQDGGSASASEMFAAFVKDHDLGPVGGTKSYGKGSEQIIVPDGITGPFRVTHGRFTGPEGTPIDGIGVIPDIAIEQNEEGEDDWGSVIDRMHAELSRP